MFKKSFVLLFMFVLLTGSSSAQDSMDFYGNYLSFEGYLTRQNLYESFYGYCNDNNFEKALDVAISAIEADPDIGYGYKMKFRVGMLKQDIELVKESLTALADKYFFYINDYDDFLSSLNSIEEGEFKQKAESTIKSFFAEREKFLKDKLRYGRNLKVLYKELVLLNYETGDEEDFITYLKKVIPFDYNFSRFRNKPEWKDSNRLAVLRSTFRAKMLRWEGTMEQKMKTLMLVATEMRHKNASLDFSFIEDWSTHVNSYIPRILQAEDKQEFYEALAEMVARIGENHTNVAFPSDIRNAHSHCGLETVFASGKYLVKGILKKDLLGKIEPGDEITSINGMPVKDYIEANKSRYPFVSFYYFKPETHAFYRIGQNILGGKKDSDMEVGFKRINGSEFTMTLVTDYYKVPREDRVQQEEKGELVSLKILKNNFYCFRIRQFYGSEIYNDFLKLIRDVDTESVQGVIFDLRGNTGGNSGYGDQIFSHFIDKTVNNYIFNYYPANSSLQSFRGFGYISTAKGGFPIEPAKEKKFDCPVVVIINPRTGSASEDFSFLFKYHKRGTFVGLPTGGATGNGYPLALPGDGSLRICLNVDIFYSWKGIQPDYLIDYTAMDIKEQKDPQLEKALEILGGK